MPDLMELVVTSAATLLWTAVLCAPTKRLLVLLAVIDAPTSRSSHTVPTVRGGGLAIALGTATITLAIGPPAATTGPLLLISLSYAMVGLTDDFLSLDATLRLAVQATLSVGAAMWLHGVTPAAPHSRFGYVVAIAIWVSGYVNAFNFMDGINGISLAQVVPAGLASIASGLLLHSAGLASLGALAVGAACGFAPYNVIRARMFLGDVGSYFFGSWIALSAPLAHAAGAPIVTCVAPVSLYLADTSLTLARRALRRENCFEPHREHTYQRLVDGGWSHQTTALVVLAANAVTALLGLLALGAPLYGQLILATAIACTVTIYLALPALSHPRPSDEDRTQDTRQLTKAGSR